MNDKNRCGEPKTGAFYPKNHQFSQLFAPKHVKMTILKMRHLYYSGAEFTDSDLNPKTCKDMQEIANKTGADLRIQLTDGNIKVTFTVKPTIKT